MKNKPKSLFVVFVLLLSSVTSVSGSSYASPEEIIQPGETVTPEVIPGESLEHQSPSSQSTNPTAPQLSMSGLYNIFIPKVFVPRIFYVSIQGNDSNPGTQAKPWRTILKATRALKFGDTAIILPGSYNEKVEISSSGITFQAQGKVITKGVVISGNSNTFRGFTITDPSSNWGIMTSGNNNLVEGNEIYHTHQDGIWFFGSYNVFRSNYIHDILDPSQPLTHVDCFQTWGWDWNTTNVLFERNLCINNNLRDYGNQIVMLARNTAVEVRDITFRNNIFVIYNPTYAALNFWWDSSRQVVSNITVENNTIVNMTRSRRAVAIDFVNITNARAINNLFINFGDDRTDYMSVSAGSNINIRNNAIYNSDSISPNGPPHPGDIWMKNPRVVNLSGLDFHLQSTSPLINAGYNLGNLVTSDFDGSPRPRGGGYDIGAFEFPTP